MRRNENVGRNSFPLYNDFFRSVCTSAGVKEASFSDYFARDNSYQSNRIIVVQRDTRRPRFAFHDSKNARVANESESAVIVRLGRDHGGDHEATQKRISGTSPVSAEWRLVACGLGRVQHRSLGEERAEVVHPIFHFYRPLVFHIGKVIAGDVPREPPILYLTSIMAFPSCCLRKWWIVQIIVVYWVSWAQSGIRIEENSVVTITSP
nr:hypothetical protein CFP56_76548 [Quercus suber]